MNQRNAFTLIELLVVVTIIVALIAMLMPAMDKAIQATQLAVCLSNHHAIGQANAFYLSDHKDRYAMMDVWWGLIGTRDGTALAASEDVTKRPLNVYLGYRSDGSKVPVAKCPSDIGESGADKDPATHYDSVYKQVGTSYLAVYAPVNYESYKGYAGVKFVYGHDPAKVARFVGVHATYTNAVAPVKRSSLVRTDN